LKIKGLLRHVMAGAMAMAWPWCMGMAMVHGHGHGAWAWLVPWLVPQWLCWLPNTVTGLGKANNIKSTRSKTREI